MEVILKQDVHNLGYKNDIVTVKPGFARNYLLPKGFATVATETARKIHAENMKQAAFKEQKIRKESESFAKTLENITIKVGAKVSTTGKIFGSVTTIQLAEAIKAQFNIDVDRKKITMKDEHIKEVGTYAANLKIHKDINVNFNFEVIGE
jgi:large subunit ribosomal protein L9